MEYAPAHVHTPFSRWWLLAHSSDYVQIWRISSGARTRRIFFSGLGDGEAGRSSDTAELSRARRQWSWKGLGAAELAKAQMLRRLCWAQRRRSWPGARRGRNWPIKRWRDMQTSVLASARSGQCDFFYLVNMSRIDVGGCSKSFVCLFLSVFDVC